MSKIALYNKAKYHAPRAIEVLAEAMEKGESYAVRVGAAKVLLAKCIPDLKATEFKGSDGSPLQITFTVATEESKKQLEKLYERSDSGND